MIKLFLFVFVSVFFTYCGHKNNITSIANIVCDGNSLTYGFGTTISYPEALEKLLRGAKVYNKGVNGQTTLDMLSDAETDIDALYNKNAKNILVAWEVGNYLYFKGDTTEAYNQFYKYCKDRQAKGWYVIVMTMPYRVHEFCCSGKTPFGDNDETYTIKRLSVNEKIRENWSAFANDIYDIANDPAFISYSPFFNEDHVHLKDLGNIHIADSVKPKVLKALN